MKILLIGDASNYHSCLGDALRRLGHNVTVASSGSRWMRTSRDIDLCRPFPGKAGGALLNVKLSMIANRLKGFDVVHIHNPIFVDLRPHRVRPVFDRLRRDNGAVYLTALGTDVPYYEMCVSGDCPLRYNDIYDLKTGQHRIADSNWMNKPLVDFNRYVYERIDGVITALYEYDLSVRRVLTGDKIAYGGIPVDTQSVVQVGPVPQSDKVTLFLGRHRGRLAEKGTDRLERAARIVVGRHPGLCSLEIVENRPYAEYVVRLRSADIVLDQLYSYTPATNALLAMAMGQAVVSGGEPEFYDFIGERELRPIINAVPDDDALADAIECAVLDREALARRGREGRVFVERHNDALVVARRFIDFWTRRR